MIQTELSIVICTYNREKFLPDCLESLAAQVIQPSLYEIVIVNNNSTDHTDEIVRTFMAAYPLTIQYVIEKKQGLSYARNTGIELSKGKIITFIDDDAIALPNFAEQVINSFKGYPNALAIGGKIIAKFESHPPKWDNRFTRSMFYSEHDLGEKEKPYKRHQYPVGCNMSFRAEVLKKEYKFDTKFGRKGKGGLGGEEKDIFRRLHNNRGTTIWYVPSIKVFHQIDDYRLEEDYIDKLSRGSGRGHRIVYERASFFEKNKIVFSLLGKLGFVLVASIYYILSGKLETASHLIRFRMLVLKGFWQAS